MAANGPRPPPTVSRPSPRRPDSIRLKGEHSLECTQFLGETGVTGMLGLRDEAVLHGGGGSHRALERVLPEALSQVWAERAANRLFLTRPRASARSRLEPRQVIGVCAPLGFLMVWSALWPPVLPTLLAGLSAVILAMAILRIAAACHSPSPISGEIAADSALPVVTILAPLFHEAAVLPQLVSALNRIDYPADRLDIKLIIEAIDTDTLRAARQCDLDSRFEIVVVPDGSPRTKPRALNYAMRFAAGSIVCIYDAEDVPHDRQVRTAAEAFLSHDDTLACLQAPLGWYNRDRNWLTRQFALEYAAHFHAFLPMLSRLHWPLPLGGTSNFFRREALESVGGWDPYNVTEDADIGFRLAAQGYRTGIIAPPTGEEAPERLAAWLGQRTRWIKGHAQTFAVHMRDPQQLARGAGPGGPASLFATLGATVLSALLHGPTALICIALAALHPGDPVRWTALGLLLFCYVAAALCARSGARRAGFRPRLSDLATMPLYWPLQTVAAFRALRELRARPYFWSKTEHGISLAPEPECPSRSPSSSWVSSLPDSPCVPGSRAGLPTRHAARG
ncbi:MAG: family 2 glycosyl transferase [Maricaulis sp.]|nr:family 2 glycosyl transferase [Maricaulis sp.]